MPSTNKYVGQFRDKTFLFASRDNADIAKYKYLMEDTGANLLSAQNGFDSLSLLRNEAVDIVIASMFVGTAYTGLDLISSVKELYGSSIKTVFYSNHNDVLFSGKVSHRMLGVDHVIDYASITRRSEFQGLVGDILGVIPIMK